MPRYTTVNREGYLYVIPEDGAMVLQTLKVGDGYRELFIGSDWVPILPFKGASEALNSFVCGGVVCYTDTPFLDLNFDIVDTTGVDYSAINTRPIKDLLGLTFEEVTNYKYVGHNVQQVGDINHLYDGLTPVDVPNSPEAILGLTSHMGDMATAQHVSDAHMLTAEQVGLGNIPNWGLGNFTANGYTTPKACIEILMNVIPDADYKVVGKMAFIPKPFYSIPLELYAITAFDLVEYLKSNPKYLQHLMAIRTVSLERGLSLQYPSKVGGKTVENYEQIVEYFTSISKVVNPLYSDKIRCIFTSPGMYPKILTEDYIKLSYSPPTPNGSSGNSGGTGGSTNGGGTGGSTNGGGTGGSTNGGGTGGSTNGGVLTLADLRQPQYVIKVVTYDDGTKLYTSSPNPADPASPITYHYLRPNGDNEVGPDYKFLILKMIELGLTPTVPFDVSPDDAGAVVKTIPYSDGTMLYGTIDTVWYYKRPNGESNYDMDPYRLMSLLYHSYGITPL